MTDYEYDPDALDYDFEMEDVLEMQNQISEHIQKYGFASSISLNGTSIADMMDASTDSELSGPLPSLESSLMEPTVKNFVSKDPDDIPCPKYTVYGSHTDFETFQLHAWEETEEETMARVGHELPDNQSVLAAYPSQSNSDDPAAEHIEHSESDMEIIECPTPDYNPTHPDLWLRALQKFTTGKIDSPSLEPPPDLPLESLNQICNLSDSYQEPMEQVTTPPHESPSEDPSFSMPLGTPDPEMPVLDKITPLDLSDSGYNSDNDNSMPILDKYDD